MIRAHEVDVHDGLHLASRIGVDRATRAYTCAGHHQVDATKGIGCLMHKSLYLLFIRDICRNAQYLARCFIVVLTYLLLCLLQSLATDVCQDNMCASNM